MGEQLEKLCEGKEDLCKYFWQRCIKKNNSRKCLHNKVIKPIMKVAKKSKSDNAKEEVSAACLLARIEKPIAWFEFKKCEQQGKLCKKSKLRFNDWKEKLKTDCPK